jgi:hypothetical protein
MTTTAQQATAKVGDVFTRSWGYDETHVDFYEIVSVSSTGKTGKAKKVKTKIVHSDGGPSDRVTAATGDDRFTDRGDCARCGNRHKGAKGWDGHAWTDTCTWQAKTDRVTVTSYGDHAYRWDGHTMHQTGLGWGH